MPAERNRGGADSANQLVWKNPIEPSDQSSVTEFTTTNLTQPVTFTESPDSDNPPPTSTPYDGAESSTHRKPCHTEKKPEIHIPRPPSAYILFRSAFIKSQHASTEVETNHSTLSRIIDLTWQNLPEEERQVWHTRKFPFEPPHSWLKGGDPEGDKEKRKVRRVGPKDPKRCAKIAELLVEGIKGSDLDAAIREFDKTHTPEELEEGSPDNADRERDASQGGKSQGSTHTVNGSNEWHDGENNPFGPRRSDSDSPDESPSGAAHTHGGSSQDSSQTTRDSDQGPDGDDFRPDPGGFESDSDNPAAATGTTSDDVNEGPPQWSHTASVAISADSANINTAVASFNNSKLSVQVTVNLGSNNLAGPLVMLSGAIVFHGVMTRPSPVERPTLPSEKQHTIITADTNPNCACPTSDSFHSPESPDYQNPTLNSKSMDGNQTEVESMKHPPLLPTAVNSIYHPVMLCGGHRKLSLLSIVVLTSFNIFCASI